MRKKGLFLTCVCIISLILSSCQMPAAPKAPTVNPFEIKTAVVLPTLEPTASEAPPRKTATRPALGTSTSEPALNLAPTLLSTAMQGSKLSLPLYQDKQFTAWCTTIKTSQSGPQPWTMPTDAYPALDNHGTPQLHIPATSCTLVFTFSRDLPAGAQVWVYDAQKNPWFKADRSNS